MFESTRSLALLAIITYLSWKVVAEEKCGYESCDLGIDDPNVLNVHIIPHTHDDVGWLKTVDQYYYGTKNWIQQAAVQYILDTVIQALDFNPSRKFTYVEMEFFTKWWSNQSDEVKAKVKKLVNNGQLQFVLGGISMSDEATVHYEDSINQLTWGIDFLQRTFGDCARPRVAWQIDPFGHSRDQARIFHDAGYDGVYFQRMDYREKQNRRSNRTLELLWLTDPNAKLPKSAANNSQSYDSKTLFTGIFYDSYCYPSQFCFDTLCNPSPVVDDPSSSEFNIDRVVNDFHNYIQDISSSFDTNHIIIPMGCDFTFQNAQENFKSIDKLISYSNKMLAEKQTNINLIYSTPSCHTKAVNQAFKHKGHIPTRIGDFFPYASNGDRYWTGYFTSRPALKGYIRDKSNELKMCEQVHVFHTEPKVVSVSVSGGNSSTTDEGDPTSPTAAAEAGIAEEEEELKKVKPEEEKVAMQKEDEKKAQEEEEEEYGNASLTTYNQLNALRKTMGIMQHHDAVTGTEKQQVAYDYAKLLYKASSQCQRMMSTAIRSKVASFSSDPVFCDRLNISLCDATVMDLSAIDLSKDGTKLKVDILLYNPLSWSTKSWFRLPIYIPEQSNHCTKVTLVDKTSETQIQFDIEDVDESTKRIPERQHARLQENSNKELIFTTIKPIKPMGYQVVRLNIDYSKATICSKNTVNERRLRDESPFTIKAIDDEGSLSIINDKLDINHLFKPEILAYEGNTKPSNSSGAYIFSPLGEANTIGKPVFKIIKQNMFTKVQYSFSNWAQLELRFYQDGLMESQWTVGPIPDDFYRISREVIVRYHIDGEGFENEEEGEFFTDSSGRRLIKRIRGKRIYWNQPGADLNEWRITGNYFPVINRIIIAGSPRAQPNPMAMAIYTDRAEGGSSLKDKQIELMLHRRCMVDDSFGVGEALKEDGIDGKGLVVRGTHWIKIGRRSDVFSNDRQTAIRMDNRPIMMFSPAKDNDDDAESDENLSYEFSGIKGHLSNEVNVLTMSRWPLTIQNDADLENKELLIRLEALKTNLDSDRPIKLDLENLFTNFKITFCMEQTITSNSEKSTAEKRRLQWPGTKPDLSNTDYSGSTRKVLFPGTIYTFICQYA